MGYINFNNAGSSFPEKSTLSIVKKYLENEKSIGGYLAESKYKKEINRFYTQLSKLINSKVTEISFLQSSTHALNFFINSINFSKNENVIIFDNEYGSNFLNLLNKKINHKVCNLEQNGQVSLTDLQRKIDKNTKMIFLCHIASQCGDLINVEEVGRLIKKINKNIIFVLDACQSIGQKEIDVKKIKCDILFGSGRKYLRGPRGTGFIYLNSNLKNKINPSLLDIKNALIKNNSYKIKTKNYPFETFEHSPALKLGLSNAIYQINKIGIRKIEKKIRDLSFFLRSYPFDPKKIKFYENINFLSGINTFSIKGFSSSEVSDFLLNKGILTSISNNQTSMHYFKKKKIKDVIRVSFHYYNSQREVKFLIKCLIDLIENK